LFVQTSNALAVNTTIESIQNSTETQIRNLLQPLINQYCKNDCKLLSIETKFEPIRHQKTQPRITDLDLWTKKKIKISSAKISLLIDEKTRPSGQKKLINLFNHLLNTLPFKTQLETKLTLFPQESGSEKQIAKIRTKISQRIQNTISEIIRDFCPSQCMFTNLQFITDVIHRDDLQTHPTRELIEDHGMVLKVEEISGTLLLDEKLSAEDQKTIFELIRLKVASLGEFNLSSKIIKFRNNSQPSMLDPATENRQVASNIELNDKIQHETIELSWFNLILIGSLGSLLILLTYKKLRSLPPTNIAPTADSKSLHDSEVLVEILQKSDFDTQRNILKLVKKLYPDTLQALKSKWVTIDLLRYLQDHQVLEVILNLTRKESIEFLMGTSSNLKYFILSKLPNHFASELQEDMHQVRLISKELSAISERTVIQRIQRLADQGFISIIEINDRLFSDVLGASETSDQDINYIKKTSV